MSLPVIAIVGRPNVGKSSLLNALAGRRISIVDPTAGVTRDRVSVICGFSESGRHDPARDDGTHDPVRDEGVHDPACDEGVWFELVDTGGYGVKDKDNLTAEIEQQIAYAVESAAVILFVVDIREEITPLDGEVARLLRAKHDRVILVANKADSEKIEAQAGVLMRLGFGEPRCISALHGRGCRALLEEVAGRLEKRPMPPEPVMQVAIIGRQNVGKSTFVNALAGAPRVIVSEIPGTTRDAIDVRFEKDGKTFLVIDTAGVRKPRQVVSGDIEFYSNTRAMAAIRRADVVLLLIDAAAKITEVDKRLAAYAQEHFKPTIIVVNKWDLAKGRADAEDYGNYLTKTLTGLRTAPIAFTTATEGRNIPAVIDLASNLFKQARTRVETGALNRLLEQIVQKHPPPGAVGRPPKIYFATQVAVTPPTIVIFCNRPAVVKEDYRRYMEKRLAEALPFQEVPIRLTWRERVSSPRAAAAERSRG